jgi:hypothetical protein
MTMSANMPKEMEGEFRLIQDELFTIIARWRTFIDLYGTESHVALLNKTAPLFFHIVQDIFVDDVILSILRLLDPAKSKGKENLSIAHLIDHIAQGGPAALHAEVVDLYSHIRTDAAQLIKIRNKRLAHNDLAERQNRSVSLYAGVSRNFIDEQIKRLCNLMNKIHSSLSDTETYYESAGNLPNGSLALLEALRKLDQRTRQNVGV